MNTKKTLIVSLCLLMSVSWFYVEASAAEAQQSPAPLPSQDNPDYWVLRSEAVRELTSFMTKKRKELKDKYAYFPGYLEEIGKAEDYASSKIRVSDDRKYRLEVLGLLDAFEQKNIKLPEKTLTWGQVVDIAMQFVWAEGYLDVDVEGGEELESFKKILQRKERFARKVRTDVKVTVDACVQAWYYLDTVDRQQGFCAYMAQEELKEKEAKAKERAEKITESREKRQQEEWQRRQYRLRNRYGYGY
jgi:hypothetical protein